MGIFLLILIPPVRRSPYLSVFCRLLLGGDLYFLRLEQNHAAGGLCLERGGLRHDARLGGEPVVPGPAVGRTGLGLFLLLGIRTRAAATLIAAMNVIFIVGLVNAILHHMPINCGCVGEVGEPVNWLKVLKNTGMLVMCIQIFLYDRFLVLDRGGFILRDRKI